MLSGWLAKLRAKRDNTPQPAAEVRVKPTEEALRHLFDKPGTAPNLFGVVSWGCAATTWLGKALNSVPDVLCLHNVRLYLQRFTGVRIPEDEIHYLTGLRRLGVGYSLVGEIHGITRGQVPLLKRALGDGFHAAAVVRAPGPRLLSQVRQFEETGYAVRAEAELQYVRNLDGFAGVAHHVTDGSRLCFAHAANLLNTIVEESRLCRVFRCEDLTGSAQVFRKFVSHLSGGTLELADGIAEQIVSRPPLRAHGSAGRHAAIDQRWQVEILRAIVRPEAVALYAELGYEIPPWWTEGTAARAA